MITLTSKDLTYLRALVEAETIVATKKQEIIDTRGSVELVEQYNQERVAAKKSRVETIKAEQAAYLEGLVTKVEEEGYIITNSALKAQVEALRVEKAVKEAEEDTQFWKDWTGSVEARWESFKASLDKVGAWNLNPLSGALRFFGFVGGSVVDFATTWAKDITEISQEDIQQVSDNFGGEMSQLLKRIAPETYEKIQNYGDENIKEEDLRQLGKEAQLAYKIFAEENPQKAEFLENRIGDVEAVGNILVVTGITAVGKNVLFKGGVPDVGGVGGGSIVADGVKVGNLTTGQKIPKTEMTKILDHIADGSPKGKQVLPDGNLKIEVTGGHSATLNTDKVKVQTITNTYEKGFYEAKVRVFDKDLYSQQLKDPRILEEQKGWKLKSKTSTLYPDSWTKQDISDKIEQAWKNGVEKVVDDKGYEHIIGKTDDGIPLEFAVGNEPPSVFANFNSLKWK